MVVLVAVICTASAVGTIAVLATMNLGRKLIPRPKFPTNGDRRLLHISLVLYGLAAAAFVVGMVGLMTLLNTPSENVHHSTYVILLVGLGSMFALLIPASLIYTKSLNYDGPHYTWTGREKPPRHHVQADKAKSAP